MTDRRRKNLQWYVADESGVTDTWEQVHAAILMDIRDELQKLNRLLGCENFLDIPSLLRMIRANTAKPKKRKPVKR